jgi:ribonuclease-3
LYLDLGINEAKRFILEHIFSTLDEILEKKLTKDFKTIFQEFSQAEYDITPTYKIL